MKSKNFSQRKVLKNQPFNDIIKKKVYQWRLMYMNRKERRNLKKEINIFSDVISILKQYFPDLTNMFERLTDVRNQNYVKYRCQ